MFNYLKRVIKYQKNKKRFPESIVAPGVEIDKESLLGKHTVLFSDVSVYESVIGDYTYVQKNSEVFHAHISKYCSIARDVTIGLADHPTDLISTSPVFYDNRQPLPHFFVKTPSQQEVLPQTRISADVWIGQGVLIKAGVHIGTGAVIGAGAVVTKDVEAYSIVAGIPARHLRYRFDQALRERLIHSQWWEMAEEDLIALSPYFNAPSQFVWHQSVSS